MCLKGHRQEGAIFFSWAILKRDKTKEGEEISTCQGNKQNRTGA